MRFSSLLSKVVAVVLVVVMSVPSNVFASTKLESVVESDSVGTKITIDWVSSEFRSGNSYNLVEDTKTTNSVKLKVSYKNEKVIEEGFDAGELVVIVKGIGSVGRDSKIEAIVGADKESSGSKNRDWTYTWNKYNDTYTFINNNKIEPNSVWSGYFDMVWEIPSRESINRYSQNDVVAELLFPDGSSCSSNTLSFTNTTKADIFEVDIESKEMYSYEGLEDEVFNPENYAFVRYNLGTNESLKSRGLEYHSYSFNPDKGSVGSGAIVINGNTNVVINSNGSYNVELPLDNSYSENYLFVAYPKDKYRDVTVEASLELRGVYLDGDDNGINDEQVLAHDSVNVVIPKDFNFVDIPGDIYQYWKDTYYDKNVSNSITEEQGGDIPGHRLIDGTTEVFYLEGLFNKPLDISSGGINVGESSTDLGSLYTFEMVDDFIYIAKNDGTYRQMEVGEYDFEKVVIPSVNSLLNINGIPIESGKYTVGVYAYTGGSVVGSTTGSKVYQGYIDEEIKEVVLPSSTTAVRVVIGGLDVSIKRFSIPVHVNFHIQDNRVDDIRGGDNLSSGQVVNTSFIRLYQDGVWLNDDFTEDTYLDDTNLNLADKDLSVYGSYLDRERDNISLYAGEKSDYEAYTRIGDVSEGAFYTSELTIGADFDFSDYETPDIFSLYTLLPKNVDILGYDIEEDVWDLFNFSALGLSSFSVVNRCNADIIENYKNSGRTYIGLHFNFSDLEVPREGEVRVKIPIRIIGKGTVNVKSVVVIDNKINEYSLGKYEDDGLWGGDDLLKDIDNDGNISETLSYDSDYTSLVYVDSSELQMSKSVKTLTVEDFVQLPTIPLAEVGSVYTYELSIRSGESIAKNIVVTDVLEVGSNSQWKGTFSSIDLSDAESKGLLGKVWYSDSENPGVVGGSDWSKSLDSSKVRAVAVDFGNSELGSGEELNIYINMVAPVDRSLHNKVTENNFSASFSMKDSASGNSTKVDDLVSNYVQVKLSPKLKTLVVSKIDEVSGESLEGAKFVLVDKGTSKVVREGVTNSRGQIIFKRLPSDVEYILREVEAPQGYEIGDEVNIRFSDLNVLPITVKNSRKTGSVVINKVNSLDNLVKVEGAVYGLYDLENNELTREVTDINGIARISNIEWGRYYIKEISAPRGYALDKGEYYFSISKDNVDEEVKLNVRDDQNSQTSVNLVKYEMTTTGVQTSIPIRGAVFRLYNVTGGRLSPIGTYVTDSNGRIIIQDLAYGDYRFVESRIPLGFSKVSDVSFSVKPENSKVDLIVYNKRQPGSLLLYKHDNLGSLIEGAVFELYDSSGEVVLGTYETNEYGNVFIDNLDWGTYYMKEKSTLECYQLDNTWYKVDINRNSLSVYLDVVNQTKKGTVILNKTNEIGNVYLKGAVFNLYSSDGSVVRENLVTDDNGQIVVEGLEWGSYYFKEVRAPEGYSLNDELVRFSVNSLNVGVEQSIFVSNPQDSKTITISKKIVVDDINFSNGEPTFLFKVYGSDVNGIYHEYYRIIKFNEDYVLANTDSEGYVSQDATVSGLVSGVYNIIEEESSRYTPINVKGITSNCSVKGNLASIDVRSVDGGSVVFANHKYEHGGFSDNSSVANILKEKVKLSGLKAVWLSDNLVEARTDIDKMLVEVTAVYDDGGVKVLSENDWTFGKGFEGTKFPNINGNYSIPVEYSEGGITRNASFDVVIYGGLKEIVRLEASVKEGYDEIPVGSEISNDMFSVYAISSDGSKELLMPYEVIIDTLKAPETEGIFKVGLSLNKAYFSEDVFTSVNLVSKLPEPYLKSGILVNSVIANDTTSVVFTDEKALDGTDLVDLSDNDDGTVVGWYEGTVFKISSQRSGVKVIANEDSSTMFANKTSVTSFDLSYLDTSRVINMKEMFYHCYYLESLDLSGFNTLNVENMNGMFSRCNYLKNLDLSNFNTEKVIDLGDMFNECKNLERVNLSSFNTKNVESMSGLFNECRKLSTLLWSSTFTTSKVTDMSSMFAGCSSIGNIDVSWFDTSNVTNMSSMFWDMGSTTRLILTNFDTSKVTDMYQMFWGNNALTELDVSSFDTANVSDMYMMFSYCSSLRELDLSSFVVYDSTDVTSIVIGCENIKTAYARSQQEADLLNASYMKPTTWDFISRGTPIDLTVINNSSSLVTVQIPSIVESGVTNIKLKPIEEGKVLYSFKLDGVEVFGDTFVSPINSGTVTVSDVKFMEIINASSDKAELILPEIIGYGKTYIELESVVNRKLIYSFKLNGEVIYDYRFILPEKTEKLVISDVQYLEIVNESTNLVRVNQPSYLAIDSTRVYLYELNSGDIIYSFEVNGKETIGSQFIVSKDGPKFTVSNVKMLNFVNECEDLVTLDVSEYARVESADVTLIPMNSSDIIYSFKMNGRQYYGNKFTSNQNDGQNIVVSDVVFMNIDNRASDLVSLNIPQNAVLGSSSITVNSLISNKVVSSFKVNGVEVRGNSFIIPKEPGILISDVVMKDGIVIESEHNPYPNSMNATNSDGTSGKVYGEATFEGATSLNVVLDYETEGISWDWVYLYDSYGNQYGKYGGNSRKTETITVSGDYVKIVFRTDGSGNNYYGFKATISPN